MSWRRRKAASDQLAALLRTEAVAVPDWEAILELANDALVTPRLIQARALLDHDVALFVDDVCTRNLRRNENLSTALSDVACALNSVGLVPLVIKGGACLARQGPSALRILSDLDVVVDPDEVETAIAALDRIGFKIVSKTEHTATHGAATMERVGDVGQLDLHRRPPGPPSFVGLSRFQGDVEIVQLPRGRVQLPAPHLHIYLQALHDQLHDKAYWRGGFDLRHAWDTAELIRSYPVDWQRLGALSPSEHVLNAVATQLTTCHMLTGADVPRRFTNFTHRLRAKAHYWQALKPSVSSPILLAILLIEAPALLKHRSLERRLRAQQGLPRRISRWTDSLLNLLHT